MGTRTTKSDMLREVVRADPEFHKTKTKEEEYKFSNGKVFTGNPSKRGAYAPEES